MLTFEEVEKSNRYPAAVSNAGIAQAMGSLIGTLLFLPVVERVAEMTPDVVLTDLSMPGLDGITATARLQDSHPDLPVLVLTMHEDDEQVFAALRAGARGYLVKGTDGESLVRAIEAVAAGQAVYGQAVASRIIDFFTGVSAAAAPSAFPSLTGRERDVLDLMASGLRNRGTAEQLGLSEKTVRNHTSAILLKLQVPDRTAAALKAREAGLGHEG